MQIFISMTSSEGSYSIFPSHGYDVFIQCPKHLPRPCFQIPKNNCLPWKLPRIFRDEKSSQHELFNFLKQDRRIEGQQGAEETKKTHFGQTLVVSILTHWLAQETFGQKENPWSSPNGWRNFAEVGGCEGFRWICIAVRSRQLGATGVWRWHVFVGLHWKDLFRCSRGQKVALVQWIWKIRYKEHLPKIETRNLTLGL